MALGGSVLLVENQADDTEQFRRYLPPETRINLCRSIMEARELLGREHDHDCAVVDVQLPDGSGLDLIGEIEPTPVVMVTRGQVEEWEEEAFTRGAQDILSKSDMTRSVIRRAIGYAIERKRSQLLRLQLEHAARLQQLGLMAAALAHEIGNPVTFVRANLELMQQDLHQVVKSLTSASRLDESMLGRWIGQMGEVQSAAAEALQGADRITGLVGQLRSIARPTGSLGPQPVNLVEAMHAALAVASARIRSSARVVTEFCSEAPLVSGEPERIGQILTNFLLNAVQSIEDSRRSERAFSRGRIEVEVWKGPETAKVRVTDNGPGIPENVDLDSLFLPFVTLRADRGGSGLGLAVSTQIAQSLGGYVRVERRPEGTGVIAELVLPLMGQPSVSRDGPVTRPERFPA